MVACSAVVVYILGWGCSWSVGAAYVWSIRQPCNSGCYRQPPTKGCSDV